MWSIHSTTQYIKGNWMAEWAVQLLGAGQLQGLHVYTITRTATIIACGKSLMKRALQLFGERHFAPLRQHRGLTREFSYKTKHTKMAAVSLNALIEQRVQLVLDTQSTKE